MNDNNIQINSTLLSYTTLRTKWIGCSSYRIRNSCTATYQCAKDYCCNAFNVSFIRNNLIYLIIYDIRNLKIHLFFIRFKKVNPTFKSIKNLIYIIYSKVNTFVDTKKYPFPWKETDIDAKRGGMHRFVNRHCHPERSEGSVNTKWMYFSLCSTIRQILHFVQNDK